MIGITGAITELKLTINVVVLFSQSYIGSKDILKVRVAIVVADPIVEQIPRGVCWMWGACGMIGITGAITDLKTTINVVVLFS